MALTPQMEKAWMLDEAIRVQKSIERSQHFDRWNNNIEEARRLTSNAYERPTKFIPAVKKPMKLRVKNFFKCLIP